MMTMFIGNTNIHFHRELAVEKALKQKEYGMALEIGKKQIDPSHALTALRAYALSKEAVLGERLFEYPQLYGAAGLLLMGEDADRLRLTGDSLYTYLGAKPASNERPIDFFNRICREDIGSHVGLLFIGLVARTSIESFCLRIQYPLSGGRFHSPLL